MKKRILSLLLTLVMILGMIPATTLTANAASATVSNIHMGDITNGEKPRTLYWDAVAGAVKYTVAVTYPDGTQSETVVTTAQYALEQGAGLFLYGKGVYTFAICAKASDGSNLTATTTFNYNMSNYISWGMSSISGIRLDANKAFEIDLINDKSGLYSYIEDNKYQVVGVGMPSWMQMDSKGVITGTAPNKTLEGQYFTFYFATGTDSRAFTVYYDVLIDDGMGADEYIINKMYFETPAGNINYGDSGASFSYYPVLQKVDYYQGGVGELSYTSQTNAESLLIESVQGSLFKWNSTTGEYQSFSKSNIFGVGCYAVDILLRSKRMVDYGKDVTFSEDVEIYVDGTKVPTTDYSFGGYDFAQALDFVGYYFYVYDEKPEIKSVLVNGESVADGATYVSNSKSVTVKTTYDSVLSQALQDYGCTVKYKTSLNGVDYSNVTTSTSNGNGTSTQTYVQNVNSGSSLTFKSWLEVTWPNGSRDIVDEHTVTVMNVDADFESISPVPTSTELTNKYTDLGTMDLGSAATNIDFKAFPKKLSAAAIEDGWTTGRSISVTRDGVEIYNRTYADNELFGWNLKDNIDEGGTYLITLRVFAQKGEQIVEKTHKFRVFVKGSTIKTIALEGVGTPVIGKSPSTINTVKSNTDGVIVNKVVWTEYKQGDGGVWDWFNMSAGSTFESGKRYAVIVEFKHEDGYNFTANKADMTVYINGQKATVDAVYSSDAFGVTLEFDPITTPEFTTQPVGGEAPYGGTYTVNWATNFTPVKVEILQYQGVKPSYLHSTLNCSATSASLEASERGYCVRAYYNDTGFVDSNKFTITETIPAFTTQPVGGEVAPGQKLTVSWATNFTPVKTVLMKVVNHPVDGTVTTRETLGTASTAEVGAGYDYYFIRAYTETSYVDSDKFYVTEKVSGSGVTVNCIGDIDYTVSGQVVTVDHKIACKVGYLSGGSYVAITATANGNGTYSFTAPAGVTEVLLVAKGDANGDANVNIVDKMTVAKSLLLTTHPAYQALNSIQAFACNMDNVPAVNMVDKMTIAKSLLLPTHPAYQAIQW